MAEAELKRRKEGANVRRANFKESCKRPHRTAGSGEEHRCADQIRAYVESARSRGRGKPLLAQADFDRWAMWARQEADRIDPVKNGTIAEALEHRSRMSNHLPNDELSASPVP